MQNPAPQEVKVWDPFVRVFHWSVVAIFAFAYISGEADALTPHVYAGYAIGALVLARIGWGFVGTRYARFSDFVRKPSAVLSYLKDLVRGRAPRYLGHNPAGAAMILLLLFGLIMSTVTGVALYGGKEAAGPLADLAFTPFGGEALEEVHEFFSHVTLLLVGVHVLGVVVSSLLHRENLVRAMFTGRKPL